MLGVLGADGLFELVGDDGKVGAVGRRVALWCEAGVEFGFLGVEV